MGAAGWGGGPVWGHLRDVRLVNRRADMELQNRLALLEAQYRYTLKKLQQRKDLLAAEHGGVTLLKVCEPKATVHRNMREIARLRSSGGNVGGHHYGNGGGARLRSSRSLPPDIGGTPRPTELTEPPSSPPPPPQRVCASAQALSIRQLRHIATIDSIAAREKARRERRAREELQGLRELEMAALGSRVKAFVDALGETMAAAGLPAST